jgi:glycine betaine/proline transport system substrate-binding protein
MHTPIEITLATIDLSFHRAASGVVKSILRRYGIEVREILAPHEHAFELLSNGGRHVVQRMVARQP